MVFRDYYFSDTNLPHDKHLREQMDWDGYVALSVIASFNAVRLLTDNVRLVQQVSI